MIRLLLPFALALLALAAPPRSQDDDAAALPTPRREFRAAWVATVANIDWPSAPGLPVKRQQAEAVAILDRLVELNMNCVVFQVRPHADALYRSELEPWSYYLTGKQGRAPRPAYDPLEFWIEQAHGRGIELHAWFNPYRAAHPSQRGGFSSDSIVERRPDLVRELGDDGYHWMDPALPAVQDHSVAVVLDVVDRYAIDGVHFDDYFYPYRSYNDGADFPDDDSYAAYRRDGGELGRADWRRAAVDSFIERLYREIKAADPTCEFGISPFGIWRPGHPHDIRGLDQYDVLYADARKWLREGWVDYFTPQLYWPIAQQPQSFPVLLGWWQDQNQQDRHLWPGTSIGRARNAAGRTEILNQIQIVRGMLRADPGLCMFSMKVLMDDDAGLAAALRDGPWSGPALIPASPWLDDDPPRPPRLQFARARGGGVRLRLVPRDDDTFLYVLNEGRGNDDWSQRLVPAASRDVELADDVWRVVVRAVDRASNLGEPVQREFER